MKIWESVGVIQYWWITLGSKKMSLEQEAAVMKIVESRKVD